MSLRCSVDCTVLRSLTWDEVEPVIGVDGVIGPTSMTDSDFFWIPQFTPAVGRVEGNDENIFLKECESQ